MNSGIEYLSENTKERERFLRFNIQLQVDLGLDLISIPYLRLPLNSYCQLVEDIARNLRKQNREPFIIFDLGYGKAEKFSDALSFFIKKVNISIIGFNYKSFTNHAVSYDVLSQYIDKDVAFVMLNTERLDIINNQISTMHYMPFLGNDVFAVKTPQFRGGSDPFAATKQKLSSMKLIKFFNPSNLIIEPAMLRVNKPRELLNEIHESSNMRLFDILSDYDAENKDEDEYRVPVLRSLSKVHELKSSTKEFGELQKRVKSSEASDYVREKRYLESCLTNLRRTRTTHK
jgi:hypothetical protein